MRRPNLSTFTSCCKWLLLLGVGSLPTQVEAAQAIRVRVEHGKHSLLIEYTKTLEACAAETGISYAFAWKDEAYILAVECTERGVVRLEVQGFDYNPAGPAITLLGVEAEDSAAEITEAMWSSTFDTPPLRIRVTEEP